MFVVMNNDCKILWIDFNEISTVVDKDTRTKSGFIIHHVSDFAGPCRFSGEGFLVDNGYLALGRRKPAQRLNNPCLLKGKKRTGLHSANRLKGIWVGKVDLLPCGKIPALSQADNRGVKHYSRHRVALNRHRLRVTSHAVRPEQGSSYHKDSAGGGQKKAAR